MINQDSLRATSGFLDRLGHVFSNSDHLIEGSLWLGWFGLSVYDFNDTLSARQKLDLIPDSSPSKVEQVWQANKRLVLASCSTVSASSLIISWTNDVGLLNFGILAPFLNCVGYGGGAVGSGIKLFDVVKELSLNVTAYTQAKDSSAKKDIILDSIKKVVTIAFLTSALAWGILGCLKIIVGGAALIALADLYFSYTVLLFIADLGCSMTLSLFESKKEPSKVV